MTSIQNRYKEITDDKDIECIDFIFPIELNVYNTNYQKHDFIIIKNNKDLSKAFDNNDFLIEINYPVTMETSEGDIKIINSNEELRNTLKNSINICDENDEVEFEEGDHPILDLLTANIWEITFYADTTEKTSSFNSYTFSFNQDNTINCLTANENIEGDWEVDLQDSTKIIEIEFYTETKPLIWLSEEWEILNLNSEIIVLKAEENSQRLIKTLNFSKID